MAESPGCPKASNLPITTQLLICINVNRVSAFNVYNFYFLLCNSLPVDAAVFLLPRFFSSRLVQREFCPIVLLRYLPQTPIYKNNRMVDDKKILHNWEQ